MAQELYYPHEHDHATGLGNRLLFAVVVTGVVFFAEMAGGYLSNSLALLSDAGHVFTDLFALLLSWFGVRQAEKAATPRMTYGYHRIGILIALVNGITLFAISIVIVYEAWHRFLEPQPVQSTLMLAVAIVGLLANIGIAIYLRQDQRHNLNVRSAFLHVVGDALASVAVIGGAAAIHITSQYWIDPLLSVLIAVIIALGSFNVIREALTVVLEASPAQIDVPEMLGAMKQIPGVKDVHHLHVWSLAARRHALSCHVVVDDIPLSQGSEIVRQLGELLDHHFDIKHPTIQLESEACDRNDAHCNMHPTAQCADAEVAEQGS